MKVWRDDGPLHDAGAVRLRIAGALTDNLPSFLAQIGPIEGIKKVVLDFRDLERINSVGLRSLLVECEAIRAASLEIEFDKCVSSIVEQFNLLPELLSFGRVRSVLAWERCPVNHEKDGVNKSIARELVIGRDIRQRGDEIVISPAFCIKCGRELERSDVDELLFGFIKPH